MASTGVDFDLLNFLASSSTLSTDFGFASMFSRLAVLLLSLGSVHIVGSSSTPSPVPASGADFEVAAEPTPNILTIYNDGRNYIINDEASSFKPGTIAVTGNTMLKIETNGYIEAPDNGYKSDTAWPAVRLSIGSVLNATGGSITGSLAMKDGTNGGEAVEIYNGQFSPETASYGYFYDGTNVVGGDAQRNGAGGTALHIHGFGTSVFIYGGNFRGGEGSDGVSGFSIYASNGGNVDVHAGSFEGEMEVGDSSVITFYGCFRKNGTEVTGVFADETYLEVNVRTEDGGRVVIIPVSDQECDTAPSTAPSPFPTLSPKPTVQQPNGGSTIGVYYGLVTVGVFTLCDRLR